MNDAARFPLLHRFFAPTACQVGDTLTCPLRGELTVAVFSSAPVPWPLRQITAWHRRRYRIVCGDLLRA